MKSNKMSKTILLLTAVALMMVFVVGGTLAYLTDKTESVQNTFTPTDVDITVDEDFEDKTVKKDVTIINNGKADAFVRAMVLVSWKNEVGDILPVNPSDYTITWTRNGWSEEQDDGFYYYLSKVSANGGKTGILFTDCKLKDGVKAPADDFKLHVEIIAQSVQAEPSTVVDEAWPNNPIP